MERTYFSKGELKIYFDLFRKIMNMKNLLYILMNVPSCVYKIKKKLKSQPNVWAPMYFACYILYSKYYEYLLSLVQPRKLLAG